MTQETEREDTVLRIAAFESAVIAHTKHRAFMEEYPTTNGDFHVERNLRELVETARAALSAQAKPVEVGVLAEDKDA